MTREDAEILWAGTVFEPYLRQRGLDGGLIDFLLKIVADEIVKVVTRLDMVG